MSHSIRIDSKSALVGIVAALVCVVAMGQVSVSRATTPTAAITPGYGIGNPHPRDMVRFSSWTSTNLPHVNIPANGEHEVFSVPADRWLVLLPNLGTSSTTGGCAFDDGGGGSTVSLQEDLNGSYTVMATRGSSEAGKNSQGPASSVIGWTFRPGSRVVLKNEDPIIANVRYNFFGYLTGL
jgi:hypothetical protein